MELSTLSKENISESSVNVDRMVKKKRQNLRYYFLKRTTDIILGLSILLVTSPILVLIAIGIKIDSHGPVLYAREQEGKDSKRFTAYKFRSMTQNTDDREYKNYLVKYIQENEPYKIDSNGNALYKVTNDPRVTKFGAFLRRTNLDEFPQLINVLKGDKYEFPER